MRKHHDTGLAGLMEQIISNGAEDMGSVFSGLFDLAMRLEREQHHDHAVATEDPRAQPCGKYMAIHAGQLVIKSHLQLIR